MRILHIIPEMGCGGAELLMSNICTELAARGHKVMVICLHPHHISFDNFPDKECFLQLVEVVILNDSTGYTFSFRNKEPQCRLCNLIHDFNPDIIHSHLFESEMSSRSCYYPKAKWFSHCHDNMPSFAPFSWDTITDRQKLLAYVEKTFLFKRYRKNKGTHFIAISNDTYTYFKDKISSFPITLLPNAINYNRFCPKIKHIPDESCLKLINVGTLSDKKNQTFLLDVSKVLKQRNIPFQLCLIGHGVNREKLKAKVNDMNLKDQVVFVGNTENVQEYLWNSDIYIHSATYEPLGLVLIEAMAAGLPVITLDGRGNRDLMVEGKNGFILFEQDPDKFADKIMEVWKDERLYNDLSLYANEFAKQYDINPYVDRLLEIYQSN